MGAVPTVPVREGAHRVFLKKAHEFARGMESALAAGDLTQAASSACHCVIAASDALAAERLKARAKDPSHEGGLQLVRGLGVPGAAQRSDQAQRVLTLKHRAEYDDREVTTAEARDAVRRASRYLRWVDSVVGDTL